MADSLFSPGALRAQVDKSLQDVKPHHGFVKFKVTWPDGKVTLGMAARVNDTWMVQGDLFYAVSKKDLGVSVEILGSW